MSRDNEPLKGQWYENVEEEETFRVLSVDEDAEIVEIEYLHGEIEELDLEEWHELDLELIEEPEGWESAESEVRSFVSQDNAWEWTRPEGELGPDDYLSGWYEIAPPSTPGTRRSSKSSA